MTSNDTLTRSKEDRRFVRHLAFFIVCIYVGARLTQTYGERVAGALSIDWELGRTVILILLSSLSGIVLLLVWSAATSLLRKLKVDD